MRSATAFILAPLMLLPGCQEPPQPGESRGSTTPRYQRAEPDTSAMEQATRPVRIGELGPSFAACSARATVRGGRDSISVRAAPYDAAQESGALPPGASFFVCSRSLDQRWFGIVFDTGGAVSDRCGVSRPVPSRRDYRGPCGSGWVLSADVRVVGR